jgi:hypothetical protein
MNPNDLGWHWWEPLPALNESKFSLAGLQEEIRR